MRKYVWALGVLTAAALALLTEGVPVARASEMIGPRLTTPALTKTVDPELIVAADFDADGRRDVATVNESSSVISTLLGKGDGNFQPRLDSRAGDFLREAEGSAVGDLNGDGLLDIATTTFGPDGPVALWLNDGHGRFHRDQVLLAGTWVERIVLADVTADGLVDIIVLNSGTRELIVLPGLGGGAYAGAVRSVGDATVNDATGSFAGLALGDISGDGIRDAVITVATGQVGVVRLGLGDGRFGPERDIGTAEYGDGLALADLNRDGALDLAATLEKNKIVVVLGRGDGTFGPLTRYAMSHDFLKDIAVADLNLDGFLDVATVSLAEAPHAVRLRLGRGDGTLGPLRLVGPGDVLGGPIAGDFDGDARTDLAYISALTGQDSAVGVSLNWTGLAAPPCVVQPLRGHSLRAARRRTGQAGCRLREIRRRHSRQVRRGRVISVRPGAGTVLATGAPLDLTISLGSRPASGRHAG